MKIRISEDYYFLCCDWCDSENQVLWAKLQAGPTCGACHRPLNLPKINGVAIDSVETLQRVLQQPSQGWSVSLQRGRQNIQFRLG